MELVPKNIEEALVYAVLLAVIALWRSHAKEKDRCEKANLNMREEIREIRLAQVSEARDMAERGEERERLLSIMVNKVTVALDEQREVIRRSIKMLMRYDADPTPRPGEADNEALFLRPHRQKKDDETSAIFKDEMKQSGR